MGRSPESIVCFYATPYSDQTASEKTSRLPRSLYRVMLQLVRQKHVLPATGHSCLSPEPCMHGHCAIRYTVCDPVEMPTGVV